VIEVAQVTKRFVIEGMVQGVGMRMFISRAAKAAGLTGYVKNLSDGTVEVVARGTPQKIEKLKHDIVHSSPGNVKNIHSEDYQTQREFNTFNVSF